MSSVGLPLASEQWLPGRPQPCSSMPLTSVIVILIWITAKQFLPARKSARIVAFRSAKGRSFAERKTTMKSAHANSLGWSSSAAGGCSLRCS